MRTVSLSVFPKGREIRCSRTVDFPARPKLGTLGGKKSEISETIIGSKNDLAEAAKAVSVRQWGSGRGISAYGTLGSNERKPEGEGETGM
jgi:hypothetical protein